MKEFSQINSIVCQHNARINFETLVFSSMIGGDIERTYGLKVTVRTRDDGYQKEETCLIDQDELSELVSGLEYLDEKIAQLKRGVPDYTEIQYVTKDGFKVGFFINPGPNPTSTMFCSSGIDTAFMSTDLIAKLKLIIEAGIEKLQSVMI